MCNYKKEDIKFDKSNDIDKRQIIQKLKYLSDPKQSWQFQNLQKSRISFSFF